MTRPEIIRADSIDLQDHNAPSAKNHPAHLNLDQPAGGTGIGNFAPHQAETLREVAAEQAEEELHSPRVSWTNGGTGDLHHYDTEDHAAGFTNSPNGHQNGNGEYNTMATTVQHDDLAVAQNGGLASRDNMEDGELDGDEEDLDDDMMDKISSSPSIDDGGSTRQLPSFDSIHLDASPCSSPASACFGQARSSSPYLDLPDYLPLQHTTQPARKGNVEISPHHHHHPPHPPSGAIPEGVDEHMDVMDMIQGAGSGTDDDGTTSGGLDGSSHCSGTIHHQHKSKRMYEMDIDEAIFGMEDQVDEADDLVVPYEGPTDDDEDDDDDTLFLQSTDPRFIDSGWGGECLHDTEDIDFELVYALHTFIATVEGQANATKGDAMVLLDDSNSYWWLVRVVKDSSIGYLPAEHIETPTERLARLNKHRNIDLSATMLGDQADKAKNPIKTAIRRRKAKNVSFAAPTYVDYSDFDYDTEEEEEAELFAQQQQQQRQQQQQQQSTVAKQANEDAGDKVDETAKVAPLKPRGQQKSVQVVEPVKQEDKSSTAASKSTGRSSEEIFETNGVEGPKKKADGTVRDSFFKDDTVETKKITLTPNLLRDDGTVRASTDSDKGIKQRPSLDKLEKDFKDDKKKGRDKKDKDKKGGFRSLFSRKDKKQRGDEDDESFGKRSMDAGTDFAERPSEDINDSQSPDKDGTNVQRNPSKLHKQQPRVEPSLSRKPGAAPREAGSGGMDLSTFLNEDKLKNVSNVPPASMRIVDPDADLFEDESDIEPSEPARSASMDDYKQNAPKQAPARSQSVDDQPSKTTTAKSRMQIEDSETEDENYVEPIIQPSASVEKDVKESGLQPQPEPEEQQEEQLQRPTLPGAFPDSYSSTAQSTESNSTVTAEKAGVPNQPSDRLSESPVQVSPITPSESQPPALTGDSSSQEDHSSPPSSPSPELIDREESNGAHRNQDSITTSTSTTTVSAWNDTSLRAFFDSGTDIRDLLVVVYDKSDVEPVGSDHPVAGALFKEQNAKLAEITTQLDNMLGDWLARKQRLRGTV